MDNNKDIRINTKYKTNEGYDIEIIDYINRHNVIIKFCDYPVIKTCTMQNIINGQIKNPYHRSVLSVGYFGVGPYTARLNGEKTPYYIKWMSMMNRCYNPKVHILENVYEKCEVCPEWHNFQIFAGWYNKHIYPCMYKLELDKDFFIENNTVYSPYTCCFLPDEINCNLNYTRHNIEYLIKYYEKYYNHIPHYISERLRCMIVKEKEKVCKGV